ncbi:MAG: AAA domain-containing protein [Methanomassiliicoccus sp.]|nr:AAA domain-containing protein [Methanomassiliicoccus sp.]
MSGSKRQVIVTDIGEYINQRECERSFKLRINKAEIARRFPFYGTVRSPLNPILATRGRKRESELRDALAGSMRFLNPGGDQEEVRMAWTTLLQCLADLPAGTDCFAREVEIEGPVGEFSLFGRMDFLILRWEGGVPHLRIVECKASRRDKTYHRIQLSAYRTMVREILERDGLVLGGQRHDDVVLESVVARIDEETNEVQDALTMPSLDLDQEMGDLRSLLAADGPLARIDATALDALSYCLEAKCDACVHAPICLPESARQRRLELIGLDPASVRSMRDAGIHDLDALADLDPRSREARRLRSTVGFSSDLDDLIGRAKARRSTLVDRREGDWEVIAKRHSGPGLLPSHDHNGLRLVRVFLDVEYDYIEDRLVGLAAHVTDSDMALLTPRTEGHVPVPALKETSEDGVERSLRAEEVVRMITSPWSDDVGADDSAEGALLQTFFQDLVAAIVKVGGAGDRPLHFYTWSMGDMDHLIDACSRAGGGALHDLTELLGCRAECRADLEQTIVTPLRDEIEQKVMLGYTGLSPVIASSLSWFGRPRFHWTRQVGGEIVDLSASFRRDIFDFRTKLHTSPEGGWSRRGEPGAVGSYFEVRAHFSSDVSSPYWYAMWGILPEARGRDNMLPRALEDYRRGGTATLISSFLLAKCQALRWLEERLFTTAGIVKPPVPLGRLREIGSRFASRYDIVDASLDFLRLDHHASKTEWLIDAMRSPASRVADGSCLPLRDLGLFHGEDGPHVGGLIDLERYSIDKEVYSASSTIDEGGYVRIVPYSGDIERAPNIGDLLRRGVTAKVDVLVPDADVFEASIYVYSPRGASTEHYILPSHRESMDGARFALAGESLSDFVHSRVDKWLSEHSASRTARWFDPQAPSVPVRAPPSPEAAERWRAVLQRLLLNDRHLDDVQVQACLDGLACTVQLLLGPPGTGKTNTTAAAVMLRLASRPRRKLFFLSASTHTAVDELTGRIRDVLPVFRRAADEVGINYNTPTVLRLTSDRLAEGEVVCTEDAARMQGAMRAGDLVLCGTINEVLKSARTLNVGTGAFADGLIIDEASMMVFADFLALTTLVAEDGEMMLAGDHMQLAPITAHDWEDETREQVLRLTPHQSAYRTVNDLASRTPPGAIGRSALSITYRLTPELTHLISGVYSGEGVDLRSWKGQDPKAGNIASLGDLWKNRGVFLVVHDEAGSKKSNDFESQLIRDIMASRGVEEHEVRPRTVSVITPHRAQRGLLKNTLNPAFGYHIKLIDTVERLQGGECETIIVSGTQSDTGTISNNAEFILDLNRTNVIFSRAQERLIVVCSRNLLDSMPADIDDYASAWLWKHLRAVCDTTVLEVPGYEHRVDVRVPGRFWGTVKGKSGTIR